MYCRAANMFKMAKNWSGIQMPQSTISACIYNSKAHVCKVKESICQLHCQQNLKYLSENCFCTSLFSAAGNAFCKAARLHMQLQNKHDCATSFIDAGNAFKKSDPNGKTVWLLNGIKSHFFTLPPNQTYKNFYIV